ncbi:hypothetical protein J6590_006480 [Homalodisca vitripennis]|nr:hypothetical protein J6590_006480 [Homalodisca vitripennis]
MATPTRYHLFVVYSVVARRQPPVPDSVLQKFCLFTCDAAPTLLLFFAYLEKKRAPPNNTGRRMRGNNVAQRSEWYFCSAVPHIRYVSPLLRSILFYPTPALLFALHPSLEHRKSLPQKTLNSTRPVKQTTRHQQRMGLFNER